MVKAATATVPRLAAGVLIAGTILPAAALAVALSPAAIVAGGVATAAAVLIIVRPETGALVLALLMALVDRDVWFNNGIPFVGGGLKAPDLIVALTLAAWWAAMITRPERYRRPPGWVLVGLAALGITVLGGVLTARAAGTPLNLTIVELRPLANYLLVLPVVSTVLSLRDLELAVGIFLGACALAAGDTLMAYVAGEGEPATFAGGATRVTNDAFLAPMLAAVWSLVLLAFSGSAWPRLMLSLLAVVSVAAVFFTFQRGAWLAALAAMALAFLFFPRPQRSRAAAYGVALIGVLAAAIIALNSLSIAGSQDPLTSGLERLESLEQPQRDPSSLHRVMEWERSMELIKAHPITGIGLGGSITFWSPMYSEVRSAMGGSFQTFYIHNSYVWLALKLGLPGLITLVAFVLAALAVGGHAYFTGRDPRRRRLLLGGLLTLVTMLLVSASGPHLTVDRSGVYVICAVGLVVAASRIDLTEPQSP
jgi:O-antigen ligase